VLAVHEIRRCPNESLVEPSLGRRTNGAALETSAAGTGYFLVVVKDLWRVAEEKHV